MQAPQPSVVAERKSKSLIRQFPDGSPIYRDAHVATIRCSGSLTRKANRHHNWQRSANERDDVVQLFLDRPGFERWAGVPATLMGLADGMGAYPGGAASRNWLGRHLSSSDAC